MRSTRPPGGPDPADDQPPRFTFHLVPRDTWEQRSKGHLYEPESLRTEGFVHCTDGLRELAATANRHFREFRGELLALRLDRTQITAPIRYEDPGAIYPHVYGAIPEDAVTTVVPLPRAPDGTWLPPG